MPSSRTWNSLLGSAQCGLTITGFNLGFGGLGGGLSCPKLTFGGGGPPIATIGIGVGTGPAAASTSTATACCRPGTRCRTFRKARSDGGTPP